MQYQTVDELLKLFFISGAISGLDVLLFLSEAIQIPHSDLTVS